MNRDEEAQSRRAGRGNEGRDESGRVYYTRLTHMAFEQLPANMNLTRATLNRRRFFATGASGLGTLALASMLEEEGALAADVPAATDALRTESQTLCLPFHGRWTKSDGSL